MAEHVLIVEDEASLAEAVAYALQQEGLSVTVAADGHGALSQFEQTRPALVVLDLMLPGINGWDLFQAFRKQRPDVPVIMLTARAEEADRVAGLEMGADDYVTKPFSMRELVARVRTVLRRAHGRDEPLTPTLNRAGIVVDRARHEVTADGEPVRLTPREFDLLAYLMEHAGRVRTRDQILQGVWAQEDYLDERTVDVHIRWLRTKIEADPAHPERLLTVRGVGYKFTEHP